MAHGFTKSREHRQMVDAKMAAYGGPRILYFGIENGESATIRFLEQDDDVVSAYTHRVEIKGRDYPVEFICCDQDESGNETGAACPGCENGERRTFKGFLNIIWRDAPVWKTDKDDKLVKDKRNNKIQVGNADQIALWKCSWTTFEELDGKNATYKGLKSRDFIVTRHGEGMKTRYQIEPKMDDEGNAPRTPLSDADKKLEADKYDLKEMTKVPSFNKAQAMMKGVWKPDEEGNETSGGNSAQKSGMAGNIFAARAQAGASKGDDD